MPDQHATESQNSQSTAEDSRYLLVVLRRSVGVNIRNISISLCNSGGRMIYPNGGSRTNSLAFAADSEQELKRTAQNGKDNFVSKYPLEIGRKELNTWNQTCGMNRKSVRVTDHDHHLMSSESFFCCLPELYGALNRFDGQPLLAGWW